MTVQNPAVFLQSEAHPAEDVRRMFGAMAGASGGIVGASDLQVTETSGAPSMGVDVAGGQVWIPGSEATYQGVYFAENRGVETLTIGASDPTNGRYDLIVAKVEDSAYSGSVNAWSLVVVAGTADPSPVDPATPANSITLARVTVGAGVSTITDANITDLRTFADGSPAYAADSLATYADSTARTSAVPSPSEGDISYLADTDTVEVYDGSAWAAVAGGKILQVVSTFVAGGFATSSTSFVDVTGHTVTITPSSTSSEVFVIYTAMTQHNTAGAVRMLNLVRDGTNIAQPTSGTYPASMNPYSGHVGESFHTSLNYLDSPATTSAVTYKIQAKTDSGTLFIGRDAGVALTAPSMLTVMEVSA